MSHAITERPAGIAEMAYVGEKPWHGLGQRLDETASVDEWRAAAGMDWRIQRSKVRYFCDAAGATQLEWPAQHVLFRSDNHTPLGVVSDSYRVVQPAAVLEFFRDLVADAGLCLHTAGTLFGGRKFWALAKFGEATLAGWDRIGGFLLLSSSCDGSASTELRETSVRVVCNNTLTAAVGTHSRHVVRVSHRAKFDDAAAKRMLGERDERFAALIEAANALTKRRVTPAAAADFVQRLLQPEPKLLDNVRQEHYGEAHVLALFQGAGKGAVKPGSLGTAWGLLNAVTEWVDHHGRSRGEFAADNRLDRALFGAGDALKTRALDLALATL